MNAITSFSNTPLVSIFYVGVIIVVSSLAYSIFLMFNYFFYSKTLAGFTSIMISLWLLGGLIISFLGLIGIYLAKVFSEVKRRPYTIIKEVYRNEVKFEGHQTGSISQESLDEIKPHFR